MSKPVKSQWEFDDLFPRQPARQVLSVSELTGRIRRLLEQQVGAVWVTGEVTNLRAQNSGHVYFTLKDAAAQLSCVLFRGETVAHRELLQDGQKLLLQGDVTVYEPRGQYQLIVHAIELQGVGALQIAFERLKQRLQAEGLFAPERKRPLPAYPQRVGLVTSPTGAAIRDVLHVVRRRNPGLEIYLAACRVQGDGAAREIAAAIRLLNEFHQAGMPGARPGPPGIELPEAPLRAAARGLDLILVTRGGGSLEDLWAFNEEVVARAIFDSEVPVVSAVGHEVDFTISDFVADVRAATPSAAAEIITEGVFSSCQFVADARARVRQLVRQQYALKQQAFSTAGQRLARQHPRRRLNERFQRLDDLRGELLRRFRQELRRQQESVRECAGRLARVRPGRWLQQRRERVEQQASRLRERAVRVVGERRHRLDILAGRLGLLGPEQVLARGYSITRDATTGRVLRDPAEVVAGQRLRTRLAGGEVTSRAEG